MTKAKRIEVLEKALCDAHAALGTISLNAYRGECRHVESGDEPNAVAYAGFSNIERDAREAKAAIDAALERQ